MATQSYLGLDLGTSALKAVVTGPSQEILCSAEAKLTNDRPRPGWTEQDPEVWWQALLKVCRQLAKAKPKAWKAIGAIGLSGQMHGVVLLDRQDRVVRPAILWNDNRAAGEARQLNESLPGLGHIAGIIAMASFPAPKLIWLRRNEPKHLDKTTSFLVPKDYLRLRLTGERVTDPCDASGTLLIDATSRSWSKPIVQAVGIDPAILPRIAEGSDVSGLVTPEAAKLLGLKAGIPVAAGAGDAAAGAISIGAVDEGDGFISLGTSAQYFVSTESYRPKPERLVHAYCHSVPNRWFQMAALLNGASPLAWAQRVLGIANLTRALAAVEKAGKAPSSLLFLPYLEGERTPHDDPLARGVFQGLDPTTGRLDLLQATLDGGALALADCQDVLAQSGTRVEELSIIGGGAKSRYWVELIASALNRRLKLHEGAAFGPAFGAARLARLALTGEAPSEVCIKPKISHVVEPDPRLAEAYARKLPQFRALYSALRPLFRG